MKHIIKYRGVLQESESAPDSKLEDVRYLFDLGMVDHAEFIARLLEISEEHGVKLESILRPTDRYYNIQVSDMLGGEELDFSIDSMLDRWRGPRGEAVAVAKGTIGEDWLDLDLVISSGTKVKIDWTDRSENMEQRCYAQVDGVQTHMTAAEAEEAIDAYYDYHDNWDQYISDLITLTVKSSY
jgi:hypothetical protein